MKLPMHPALPNTIGDNDAHLTHPSSTYKSGNVVQINGATSTADAGFQIGEAGEGAPVVPFVLLPAEN
jgi:hypothetical protein